MAASWFCQVAPIILKAAVMRDQQITGLGFEPPTFDRDPAVIARYRRMLNRHPRRNRVKLNEIDAILRLK